MSFVQNNHKNKINKIQKTLLLASMCTVFSVSAQANSVHDSSVKSVTIYQGSASVHRQLPVQATGEQHLIFNCLSGNIQKNSVHVNAPKHVKIGELHIQTLTGEDAKLCQDQGNIALQTAQSDMNKIQAKIIAAETSFAYLNNFGKTSHLSNKVNIANTATSIQKSTEKAILEINYLKNKKSRLQRKIATMKNSSGNTARKVTQISVRLASRKPSNVTLSYLVDGAYWKPQYQASLNTQTNKLTVELQAIISQKTGENWHNVHLTLSTVKPSYQTASNDPYPKYLSLYEPRAIQKNTAETGLSKKKFLIQAEMATQQDSMVDYTPIITSNTDIVEYKLPQKISIPSDGRQVTTKLDSKEQSADTWIRVVPSQGLKGFWHARVKEFNKNWLIGDMNVYRDGNYVGSGKFHKQQLQTSGLGFGVNNQVLVKKLSIKNVSDKKGLFNNINIQNIEEAYRVTNKLNRAMKIEVVSGVPVIRNNDIQVQSDYKPKLTQKKWQEREGLVSWELYLQPNTFSKVTQQHVIEYPKGMKIKGL